MGNEVGVRVEGSGPKENVWSWGGQDLRENQDGSQQCLNDKRFYYLYSIVAHRVKWGSGSL